MKRSTSYGMMLVVTVVIGVPVCLAVLLHYHYRSEVQRLQVVRQQTSVRVGAAFRKMGIRGSSVIGGRNENGDSWYFSYMQATGDSINDAALVHLEGLADAGLAGLTMTDTDITDEGLKSLRNLNELRYLKIDGTRVTDAGMEHLLSLGRLTHLDVSRTAVSQDSAGILAEMSRLEVVYAAETSLRDVPNIEVQHRSPDKFELNELVR